MEVREAEAEFGNAQYTASVRPSVHPEVLTSHGNVAFEIDL